MRAAFFASFAFLAACASGAPSEYQRGTFTPPPPAPVRAGVGAPVFGQPGMQPRSIPVSPHKRVLPPTREPGVWAVDKPPKGSQLKPYALTFPDTDYEYPLPDEPGPAEVDRAEACGRAIYRSTIDANALEPIKQLSMIKRRCVLSKTYETCTRAGGLVAEAVGKQRGFDPTQRELWWLRLKQTATADAKMACSLVSDMGDLTPLIDAIIRAFNDVKGEFIHT